MPLKDPGSLPRTDCKCFQVLISFLAFIQVVAVNPAGTYDLDCNFAAEQASLKFAEFIAL